jgi:hypothetical protein
MKKIIGAVRAVFAGLLVLLPGCPTDTVIESGEEYIASAVLVNEKAKYNTAVTLRLDETDAALDVTDQFIQLKPGQAADNKVAISVYSADGSGYFSVRDGRIVFTGVMPVDADFVKEEDGEYEAKEGDESIERTGIPGEVITLLFQKGDENATLEVLGIIEKKGREADEERITVSEENTFVLYGYDVIRSAYINRGDVKITRPILDVAKVNQADMVRQSVMTTSLWESVTGESVSELMQSLNASLSVEYKAVVFSGKVEAEFSTSSNSKATTRYAKGRGFHLTRDEFLRNTAPSTLKTLLHDTFTSDINTKDAAYILDNYGTHLMVRCYWGGEAEFNYSYTGTELTTEQDIKAALNATYGGFTGTASTEAKQKASELNNNSSFTTSSRGGNNTSFTTVEQFTAGYDAWVKSIAAKPDICGIPSFDNNLIPIWTIVAEVNSSKASQILQEFNRRVNARGIALEGFKYVPPAKVYTYVTAVNVVEQQGTNVPSGYTNLVRTDMYNPNGGDYLDANNLAGGAWIRIPYKTEINNNNHNAIADLRVANTGGSSAPPNNAGWTTINFDLNKGAGGPYLWLQYRKVNQSDTEAIDFIGSYAASNSGSGEILSGYSWAGGRVDLNTGAGGAYIYLTVHKSPFKW